MKTLRLTVLASEGPQARAYLVRMRCAGLRPERIVLIVPRRPPGARGSSGRWLPRALRLLRLALGRRHEANRQLYWPRRLMVTAEPLVERIRRVMGEHCTGADEIIDAIVGGFRYEDFADTVEPIAAWGLGDPALASALATDGGGATAVLFTGGGIVPRSVLATPGVRLIHVHPGHLPEIRGADGLLWSLLIRGRPGMSCFYMAEGIDTGALVSAEDLPELAIPTPAAARPADEALYQATFSFVDPLLRAEFLASRVLARHADLAAMPARPQDTDRGETYHFLHPGLRRIALERLFGAEGA